MDKLRVAVIGCGNISVMHLDSIKAFDDVERLLKSNLKDLIDDENATKKMMQSIFISLGF